MTRAERRHRRDRKLRHWLRIHRAVIAPMHPQPEKPFPPNWSISRSVRLDPVEWARDMLGRGSLSIQNCLCCHRLRRKYGPRFGERRRLSAMEAE